ncbi:MAG: CocE/NonD family hydrolase [Gemmatimonadota bacterium]|nr:CocE/NonD family hydrolase [Gemmatimonadota bacterium]
MSSRTVGSGSRARTVEHTWVRLRDGCRLSARLWIPEGAKERPVPAVVEYIPYRKRDLKRPRDHAIHAYFAEHGYASVRVDMRGSGDSEGILVDEYLLREQEDGEDVLRWIASQPWCDGSVGMIGISWGGFNGLQLAQRRPPELKAVIAVCATDDRYADDVHYKGGCLLSDNLSWASTMFAFNSLPPDPEVVGERWREMWFDRLERSGLWVETWMRHPCRDEYWKHGSVCEDYAAIEVPVMMVSGWADGYSNPVFRLMANLSVPRLGIIGPWSHVYPHMGSPGPRIGFLQEALRWWDQWLKGEETGIMQEPMLRLWMQDHMRPRPEYEHRSGRWVGEDAWPSPNVRIRAFRLEPQRLVADPDASGGPAPVPRAGASPLKDLELPPRSSRAGDPDERELVSVQSPLNVGLFAGKWCSYAAGPDLPYDQRLEDGGSLVFDTEPLEEPLEILGAPIVEFELATNRPAGMIAVRLSDIAPDDKATRVTYGLLKLAHRESHETPEPMLPGRAEVVRVALDGIAQRFRPGHRIRLAVSTSYWPLAWPPPEPVTLTLRPSGCRLLLPEREAPAGERVDAPAFEEPEAANPTPMTVLEAPHHDWRVIHELANERSTLHVLAREGTWRLDEIDLEVRKETEEWYRFQGDRFTSVSGEIRTRRGLRREGWSVETLTRTVLSCTEDAFHIHATLDAYEGGRRVFSRIWDPEIPREDARMVGRDDGSAGDLSR